MFYTFQLNIVEEENLFSRSLLTYLSGSLLLDIWSLKSTPVCRESSIAIIKRIKHTNILLNAPLFPLPFWTSKLCLAFALYFIRNMNGPNKHTWSYVSHRQHQLLWRPDPYPNYFPTIFHVWIVFVSPFYHSFSVSDKLRSLSIFLLCWRCCCFLCIKFKSAKSSQQTQTHTDPHPHPQTHTHNMIAA